MARYLKLIRGIYYYWRKIPLDILLGFWGSAVTGKGAHVKVSLKTKQLSEAKKLAAIHSVWLEKYFFCLRLKTFTNDEIDKIRNDAPFSIGINNHKNDIELLVIQKSLLDVYELYEQEHIRAQCWREKTKKDQRQMVSLCVQLLGGNVAANSINKSQLIDVKEKICRLPPNLNKVKKYKNRSLEEILNMHDVVPMSHTRAYRIVSHLGAFFRWMYKRGYIENDVAIALSMPKKKHGRLNEERVVYDADDLAKMFSSPVFEGKRTLDRPENFFIPLISMYTGMRLNEIAQLYCEDIVMQEGIAFISINDEYDKLIKNPTSKRLVPLHPTLVEIGLLKFVEAIRHAEHPRLWMSLTRREDSYGKQYSSAFQRLNRKYITEDPKKVFHSFRHGFASQLKENGVRTEIIAELLGHSHGSISLDRYSNPYSIEKLYNSIRCVNYPLPLEQLKFTAEAIISELVKAH